jgi:hypothetical protein
LYCQGTDDFKTNQFFQLTQTANSQSVINGSAKILRTFGYIAEITCIVMSEAMLKEGEIFEDEEDEIQFEEMHKLFTTNPLVLREFANSINDSLFE